jgi:hypothetical protein
LYWELIGPFLLAAYHPWTRCFAVLAFFKMHFAFFFSLDIGIFPVVDMACVLVFLPPAFWDAVGRKVNLVGAEDRLYKWMEGWFPAGLGGVEERSLGRDQEGKKTLLSRAFHALVFALAITYPVVQTIGYHLKGDDSPYGPTHSELISALDPVATFLGVHQRWNMFAPTPTSSDQWFVFRGILRNGTVVDATPGRFGAGEPSLDRPMSLQALYETAHHCRFTRNLSRQSGRVEVGDPDLIFFMGEWLCENFKRQTGIANLETIEVIRIKFRIPGYMEPQPRSHTEIIGDHLCG